VQSAPTKAKAKTPKPASRQATPPASRAKPPAPAKRTRPALIGAALAAATDDSGRAVLLASLALLVLVLSSGSLLHLLSRSGLLWRKA
jgi:hypothetical protein